MHSNTFDAAQLSGKGMKFALVVSRFNDKITSKLHDGCLKALAEHEVSTKDAAVFHVPGSFEIPLIAKLLAQSQRYEAIIALGAVVKGET
ncbi:6,7-dimethyl-8-ribityllumazine synthase, partial [Candidatus Uhrbacteria bacterium]|nr:6,7-dimethyl-8-ribityllumazine synthase [Candidatus Uhrbacteria bacterium]